MTPKFHLLLFVFSHLAVLLSASPSTTEETPETDELSRDAWATLGNPSLLVSLAVFYNNTGLCQIEDSSADASGGTRSSILAQEGGRPADSTRTSKRDEDSDSSLDLRPTPAPTGNPQAGTTVHIASEHDFALLLPGRHGELISDAEADGVALCTPGSGDSACTGSRMQDGFIAAAAVAHADDGSWIQVTGCLDVSKSHLDPSDEGGQFDVRFPNGAQCTFGGYAASFIEQVEPGTSRFCLRCCASANDQVHCNSHRDREGCVNAIPGTYDFPEVGVSCN
ncbi:hypothetical protein PHLGIDRAFT_481669 [Phlebiopsis gigantea 11061_1 CR5-6]|uniref:Uncharacterized protein n=1 Tax=Phlebiopsis gigantea (strain 11061_1 CR5-6) TaxID=745531 RepID=A0A0C3RWI6_PHLG1|nr:hypothetical protein PHLGIDRAFT_481669 [Phlebiopsis gigantea 11061_1 CR5-6]